MGKGKNAKKATKKPPTKTAKEKKAEKKLKKANKDWLLIKREMLHFKPFEETTNNTDGWQLVCTIFSRCKWDKWNRKDVSIWILK